MLFEFKVFPTHNKNVNSQKEIPLPFYEANNTVVVELPDCFVSALGPSSIAAIYRVNGEI